MNIREKVRLSDKLGAARSRIVSDAQVAIEVGYLKREELDYLIRLLDAEIIQVECDAVAADD